MEACRPTKEIQKRTICWQSDDYGVLSLQGSTHDWLLANGQTINWECLKFALIKELEYKRRAPWAVAPCTLITRSCTIRPLSIPQTEIPLAGMPFWGTMTVICAVKGYLGAQTANFCWKGIAKHRGQVHWISVAICWKKVI